MDSERIEDAIKTSLLGANVSDKVLAFRQRIQQQKQQREKGAANNTAPPKKQHMLTLVNRMKKTSSPVKYYSPRVTNNGKHYIHSQFEDGKNPSLHQQKLFEKQIAQKAPPAESKGNRA